MTLLAGVVSTIGSLCAFILVIFFKKRGFVTAIALLLMQTLIMFIGFFSTGSLSGLPGLFGVLLVIIANVFIYQRGKKIDKLREIEMDILKARQKGAELLFEQTATALVNAIDAKDVYSRGHSMRVAEYSRKIAEQMGKSEEECREVYYAGLLHDVGKIGIQNAILTKKGKLTSEEYEQIKRHTTIGKQILSGISEYPYLSIAANSHHERYDARATRTSGRATTSRRSRGSSPWRTPTTPCRPTEATATRCPSSPCARRSSRVRARSLTRISPG